MARKTDVRDVNTMMPISTTMYAGIEISLSVYILKKDDRLWPIQAPTIKSQARSNNTLQKGVVLEIRIFTVPPRTKIKPANVNNMHRDYL